MLSTKDQIKANIENNSYGERTELGDSEIGKNSQTIGVLDVLILVTSTKMLTFSVHLPVSACDSFICHGNYNQTGMDLSE